TRLTVGQTTTLTATAYHKPSGDVVEIVGTDGLKQSGPSSPFSTTDVHLTPQTVHFTAYILSPSGKKVATSNTVAVKWMAPLSVTLTAHPTDLPIGQATTLTATASQSVSGTGEAINIVDQSSGLVIASCLSGTTCVTTMAESDPTTQTYQADIGPYQATTSAAGVKALSHTQHVTWYGPVVTLQATPRQLLIGKTATVTAQAQQMTATETIHLVGTDGVSQTGSPGDPTLSVTDLHQTPQTVTFTATVLNSTGQVVASSNAAQVTWYRIFKGANPVTSCVPYKPGYAYVKGVVTYDPRACPVPTPVDF
ncbi:MAG: hypothetical protein C7B43_20705, partial [Sulfobacillus benefaciens]